MEIEVRRLSQQDINDFIDLISVFKEVFEMKNFSTPDTSYLQNLLIKPNFLVLIAKAENKVVGGLTVYLLDQYYSAKPLAYIYDLGVLKQCQRQGIGKLLIKHLKDYCRKNGFAEVFVQADRLDTHALGFYRSTNATKEAYVIQFTYSLRQE